MQAKKYSVFPLCAALGVLAFIAIYGINTLNVTYDSWIFNNYIETDIVQRYAGWLAYRSSDSFLPLTFSSLIAYPFGDYASLADGMPLFMVLFKLLSPILPQTFQFCGIVACLNMSLQAISGAMLVSLFTNKNTHIILSSLLFCFSPIMLERVFRHTSLTFHWLIIFAIYLYISGRRKSNIKSTVLFCVLSVLSVWLHLYFTPMVLGFFLAYMLDNAIKKQINIKQVIIFVASIILCVLSAKCLGILDIGIGNTSGYGAMGMNINALFNPTSLDTNWWVEGMGRLDWSLILPMRALAKNNIESFNYLGLGVLLSLLAVVCKGVIFIIKNKKVAALAIFDKLKKYPFLFLFLLFSTLFAISNVICVFSYVIVEIPLPQFLLSFFNAFRASGRLFWSVNYILVLLAIIHLFTLDKYKRHLSTMVLFALIAIQIADLSPVLVQKHARFESIEVYRNQQYADDVLNIVNDNEALFYLEMKEDRALCAQLLKNNKASNLLLINRDGYNIKKQSDEIIRVTQELLQGSYPYNKCIFVTSNQQLANDISKSNENIKVDNLSSEYFISLKGEGLLK